MAAAGDIYERELKYLLSGDEKAIAKMVKTCGEKEKQAYNSMLDNPFLVIRAAGSLGVDLVVLRGDFSFPIEVKSSNTDILHFSRNERLDDQAMRMKETCERSHVIPIYAFRLKGFKGDPWRIFRIPSDKELNGMTEFLRRKIPELRTTNGGHYVMEWANGMKLSELLDYMGMSKEE